MLYKDIAKIWDTHNWVLTFSVLYDNVVQGCGQLFHLFIMCFFDRHFVMESVPDPFLEDWNSWHISNRDTFLALDQTLVLILKLNWVYTIEVWLQLIGDLGIVFFPSFLRVFPCRFQALSIRGTLQFMSAWTISLRVIHLHSRLLQESGQAYTYQGPAGLSQKWNNIFPWSMHETAFFLHYLP